MTINQSEKQRKWYMDSRVWAGASIASSPVLPPVWSGAGLCVSGMKNLIEREDPEQKPFVRTLTRAAAVIIACAGGGGWGTIGGELVRDYHLSTAPIPASEQLYSKDDAVLERHYDRGIDLEDFVWKPMYEGDDDFTSSYSVRVNLSDGYCKVGLGFEDPIEQSPHTLEVLLNQGGIGWKNKTSVLENPLRANADSLGLKYDLAEDASDSYRNLSKCIDGTVALINAYQAEK